MSNLYVVGELGAAKGRVLLGALQREGLAVSEAGDLRDLTICKEKAVEWNVPGIYHQLVQIVRGIVAQEEPVRGISFHSSATDALLFEANGSVVAPAVRCTEAEGAAELKKILAKVPAETLFEETGVQPNPCSALCQLAAESSRRLKRAQVLSLADGLNYLFSGVAGAELSQASQTQLYNPTTKSWSEQLLKAAGLPSKSLPQLVTPGTTLGKVRVEVAEETGLEDAQVVATCSHELASALAALAIADPGNWAFLWPDETALLGTRLYEPYINEISRDMKYSNLVGFGDTVGFYKSWVGLRLVEQCQRSWAEQDRALDHEVLMHLATSAAPFEAFIDPANSRFQVPGDMPEAIQAFCRETGQEFPRKPGPILRCVLESLALYYRKAVLELEYITNTSLGRLYVLGGKSNVLLNHFLANALQIPIFVVPDHAAAVGNVAMQALALGHIETLEQARAVVEPALKMRAINPHATAWTEAFDRFLGLGVG